MQIFNQYSFVLGAIVVNLVLWGVLLRWQGPPIALRIGSALLVLLLTIGLSFTLRYPGQEVDTVEDANTIINNGQPTFLMFYSNY